MEAKVSTCPTKESFDTCLLKRQHLGLARQKECTMPLERRHPHRGTLDNPAVPWVANGSDVWFIWLPSILPWSTLSGDRQQVTTCHLFKKRGKRCHWLYRATISQQGKHFWPSHATVLIIITRKPTQTSKDKRKERGGGGGKERVTPG